MITLYLWVMYETSVWFMMLPDPSNAQAGFSSAIIGIGAAWFSIYVKEPAAQIKSETEPDEITNLHDRHGLTRRKQPKDYDDAEY
jgi:hypothetical protein